MDSRNGMCRDKGEEGTTNMRARLTSRLSLLILSFAVAMIVFPAMAFAEVMSPDGTTASSTPTILSDQADYAPGATVTLTGSGWQPSEAVHIYVNDSDGQTWDYNSDVSADQSGSITDQFSLPNRFVANYSVKATGASGGVATTTFTDKEQPDITVTSSANPSTVGGSVTFTATVTKPSGSSLTANPTGSVDFNDTSPGAAALPNSCTNVPLNASQATCTTSGLTLGSHTIRAQYNGDDNYSTRNTSLTQQVNACSAASVATNPANQTVTYGASSAAFTATGGGTPSPTVQWQVSTNSGGTWTNVSSGGTSSTLTVSNPVVSQSGNQYRAVFTNTCNGTKTATSTAATLTVNPKPITITPASNQSKVYGSADPTSLNYSASSPLETGDSYTGALGRAAGENVGNYAINLGNLSAGSNYNLSLSATPVNFSITAKSITITPTSG